MNPKIFLDYYGEIIPNHDQFIQVLEKKFPLCFWVNTLKTSPPVLAKILTEEGFALEPLSWHESAFRCEGPKPLGKSWEYLAGLLQIQEEVAMIPAFLLEPKSHERILDFCAAPGNKTAQLAVMMKNQGTIIANDRDYNRIRAMGQITKRLGLMNITVTAHDGANYPNIKNYFDKVLVDAPCSGQGTLRKESGKNVTPNHQSSLAFARLQKALLSKAIHLCRPGGRIIYSTCTFAPEENEGVVSSILQEYPQQVKLLPISLPRLMSCEGLTQWRDNTYAAAVKNCLRIWPHLNNTGGFFIAVLEKSTNSSFSNSERKHAAQSNDAHLKYHLTSTDRTGRHPASTHRGIPSIDPAVSTRGMTINTVSARGMTEDAMSTCRMTADGKGVCAMTTNTKGTRYKNNLDNHLDELTERFGFSKDLLRSYHFIQEGNRGVYLVNADHDLGLNVDKDVTGLLFLKNRSRYPKLTTSLAMLFVQYATKNRLELTESQMQRYLDEEEFALAIDQVSQCTGYGYVLVTYRQQGLGVALLSYSQESAQWMLKSLFPQYLK